MWSLANVLLMIANILLMIAITYFMPSRDNLIGRIVAVVALMFAFGGTRTRQVDDKVASFLIGAVLLVGLIICTS